MAKRIFVNKYNDLYQRVTENGKGIQYGLGVESTIDSATAANLGKQAGEIFFYEEDLLDKNRKLKIALQNLTNPTMFIDGVLDANVIDATIKQYNENLTAGRPVNNKFYENTVTGALVAAGTITTALVVAYGSIAATVVGVTSAVGSQVLGSVILQALGVLGPVGWIIVAVAAVVSFVLGKRVSGHIEAKQEDDAQRWTFTDRDFPTLTAQAKPGPNRRSLQRLYDRRSGLNPSNFSDNEALARLTRNIMCDIMYSKNGIIFSEHPGKDKYIQQEFLFPFKANSAGVNQTYIDAIFYISSYISLIDAILSLNDESLSRSPDVTEATYTVTLPIQLTTAKVRLLSALIENAERVITEKTLTFLDEEKEYKTLLNFGDDRQYLAEAWRLAPQDSGSIQFKLTRPLDTDITENTTAFVGREFAKSVVDIIDFEPSPAADTTPYLRPFNMDSKNRVDSKMYTTNVSLTTLGLTTGSAGAVVNGTTISYEDSVYRRWFTGDFKSSELNIDFTDYNNFVHFGSAYRRLEAFAEKLAKIEELTSASISSSVSSSTVSMRIKAQEKENIIRKFDQYEQFLYYATGSIPYTASAFYTTDGIEYNDTSYWPKQSEGTPYSPLSSVAINWFNAQSAIAHRYDVNNPNYLVVNLPTYIQEDTNSAEFLRFFDMVGHVVDNIKVYIDQFPYIYSTNPNPLEELSMDQVYEVAQSFGLQLPNAYSLESLQTFNAQFNGESGSRSYVAETWKRFLHNMIYFAKTKGSRTSLDALLNTYGINSPILQIKETSYPIAGNYIRSDELTYGLRYTGSVESYIRVPFVSSSLTASTLQLSFNPTVTQTSSLLTAEGWAIDLIPHPSASVIKYLTTSFDGTTQEITLSGANRSTYGRVELVSGSSRTVIASSSYFPLFGTDYTNLMLRSESADMTIIQTDGDQILFRESASVDLSSMWNDTTYVYLGGSGSLKLNTDFDGIIDEVRVWGENISDANFELQSYDPGSYYGATYTSSYENLYIHLPFSQPLTSITASILNESPYQNVSIVQNVTTAGFTTASYVRVLRGIKQFTPIAGASIYTNKNITVAPSPQFNQSFVDQNGTYVLNRKVSIKRVEEKTYDSTQNIVTFAVSPTDFINQNIIRSMGVVDVNNIIGSPRYVTGSTYTSLQSIQKDYVEYFNKTVNPNDYIRFFKDLTQGPSELAETMVPARTKLIDGVVIESSVLSRNKDNIIRTLAVDGSGTKKFNAYTSGSGSVGVGAYDIQLQSVTMSVLPVQTGDTLPLNTTIFVTDDVTVKSSTKSSELPSFRKVFQKLGESFVTASIMDNQSSFSSLESSAVNAKIRGDIVSNGYPRLPYFGIPATGSISSRLDSEDNTLAPFYDIPPRSDFSDVGTYSYFHNPSGIYSYDIYSLYKQAYKVKLDTNIDSPLNRLYAPITLLSTASIVSEYGRNTTTTPVTSYASGSVTFGNIKVANIFTLYGVTGPSGTRLRLYRSLQDREADVNRSFYSIPAENSGVLFDGLLNGVQDVFPYVMAHTEDALIYYTINNLTSSTISQQSVVLEYFAYEPDNLIPSGYLPRHYKFSRDNTTALKRRNYLGCRDVNSTFDGKPPFEVSISTQNTVVVNSNQTTGPAGTGAVRIPANATNLNLGGGGRLRVE